MFIGVAPTLRRELNVPIVCELTGEDIFLDAMAERDKGQIREAILRSRAKGKPLARRIKRSELNAITGYNTYREPGLPAGPIANPGKESIAAVLNPAETKALYFVADGTGGHVFADTLQQHQANVQRWYAIRRQRGEM